jgi:hypothetical protein
MVPLTVGGAVLLGAVVAAAAVATTVTAAAIVKAIINTSFFTRVTSWVRGSRASDLYVPQL